MQGVVTKSTGSWYEVRSTDGKYFTCRTRGKLRLAGFKTTNPVAVGDIVDFDIEDGQSDQGLIAEIKPRTNYIIRQSIKKKAHGHIIAANIDQALLVATLTYPRTSLGFIDRFLVTAESFRIPQVLVFNKIDILNKEGRAVQQELMDLYTKLGVTCLEISAEEKIGLERLNEIISEKTVLISGHSGVGKSTLLNALSPEINQKTAEISDFAEKGVHTTTFAEMFEISPKTYLIDTPGIKELGLIDIEKEELSDYFPEMRELINECKYHNCEHTHEPGCAIKTAVEEGLIENSRYYNYLSMLEGDDNRR